MSRPTDTTAPLPKTLPLCIRELSRILQEMAREHQATGETARWEELRKRKDAVKLQRKKLEARDG